MVVKLRLPDSGVSVLAFTLGPPKYGPAHVRAQIQAVYDVGLKEWVLWSPGSNYDLAALAPEGGPDPVFDIPGGKGTPSSPKKVVEKKDSVPVYEGKAPPPVVPDTSRLF